MSLVAVVKATEIVKAMYPSVTDSSKDLIIHQPTLKKIKRIFNRHQLNMHDSFSKFIGHLQEQFGYKRAIFFYEDSDYPCEVVLFREIFDCDNGKEER